LAAIALYAFAGLAEIFKVLVLSALKLAVVPTGFIWTIISRFGKLLYVFPSDEFAQSLLHSNSTLKRETI